MKKAIAFSLVGILGAAALFAGCGGSKITIEEVANQFLEEDANPTFEALPNITDYESEYGEIEGVKLLVSTLYMDTYDGLGDTLDEVKDNETFMAVWEALKESMGNIEYDLQESLETRLSENGYKSDDLRYGITVMDGAKSNILFTVMDGSTVMDIFETTELMESLNEMEATTETTATTAATATEATTTTQQETTTTTASFTRSQQEAIKTAKNYLNVSAFSKEGLIRQLEYEKFSTEDAAFAVDHIDVDWQEQAVKQAEDYIKVSAFSRSGLIHQLEYEGYSTEHATYAVDHIAVDWNEQAYKQAESYLSISSFSRDELIDQLEYEGYTYDQAVYGVDKTGL